MGLLDDAIREHLELKRRRGADAGEISRLESEALGPVRRSPEGVPDLSEPAAAESTDGERAPRKDATVARPTPEHESPATSAYRPPSSTPQPPAAQPASAATPPPATYEPPPRPAYPASPPEPPPTTVLRPPPAAREQERVDLGKPPRPEPEEPAPAEEQPPSLLSRFNPARRRQARQPDPNEPPAPPAGAVPAPPPDDDALPYATLPPAADEPDIVPADDEPEGEDLLEETPEFLEETPEHDRLWFEQRPPRDFDFDG